MWDTIWHQTDFLVGTRLFKTRNKASLCFLLVACRQKGEQVKAVNVLDEGIAKIFNPRVIVCVGLRILHFWAARVEPRHRFATEFGNSLNHGTPMAPVDRSVPPATYA